MQNTERQKFEESWKDAFDGAEATPPESVWNSIELDLAGQESAVMKKKVVFYQRLAAAMLLFGLLAGGYGYYASSRSQELGVRSQELGVRSQESGVRSKEQSAKIEKPSVKPEVKDNGNNLSQKEGPKENPVVPFVAKKQESKQELQQQPQQALAIVEEAIEKPSEKTEVHNTEIINEEKKKEEQQIAVVSPLLQQLEQGPETVVEPKKSKRAKESMWLALGGSAGNYTPNTPTATTPTISQSSFDARGPALAFATVAAPKPQPKVGSSYSVGIGVGKKFGRFVVQTGVNLNKQQIDYTSNYDTHTSSNSSKAAMSDYLANSSDLTFTNEYTVSSTMDIISIPVQLGYMIVDRRLGWQINAGASNDFFLRNVLVDKSGQRERSIEESGSASPYRAVNWSALASTELSYRIGAHYRVSLVPGARYSVHSILKSDKDTGRPVVLDVGFRFRYIFE